MSTSVMAKLGGTEKGTEAVLMTTLVTTSITKQGIEGGSADDYISDDQHHQGGD
jgi:hypothetical protein